MLRKSNRLNLPIIQHYSYCATTYVLLMVNSISHFLVGNGVKQGGINSPILFSIYMDDLSMHLNSSGIGGYLLEMGRYHDDRYRYRYRYFVLSIVDTRYQNGRYQYRYPILFLINRLFIV